MRLRLLTKLWSAGNRAVESSSYRNLGASAYSISSGHVVTVRLEPPGFLATSLALELGFRPKGGPSYAGVWTGCEGGGARPSLARWARWSRMRRIRPGSVMKEPRT